MVTFERLKGQLLLGLDLLLSHLLDFLGEHDLGLGRTVDTVGLDTDNNTTLFLEEHVGVEANNTGLVRLGNIGKDGIDHGHEHTVAERVSGVLDNGDDVGTVGGHANQVTAGTVGELNGIDVSGRSDNVSDVADGGTAGRTQVQDLGARADAHLIHTTQNTGSKLATERVPHTVFGFGDGAVLSRRRLDSNALLTIDGLSGGQVLGDEQVFLTTAGNEDTTVTVGFLSKQFVSCHCISNSSPSVTTWEEYTYNNDLSTTLGTRLSATATTTSTTTSTTGSTATTAARATTATRSTAALKRNQHWFSF